MSNLLSTGPIDYTEWDEALNTYAALKDTLQDTIPNAVGQLDNLATRPL